MEQSFIYGIKRFLFSSALFLCFINFYAQEKAVKYEKGILKGVVKVKFTPMMANQLKQSTFSVGKSNRIETGISTFDVAIKNLSMEKMERLFPYDPKYENKLQKHGLHLWYILKMDNQIDLNAVVSDLKRLEGVSVVEVSYEKVLPPYQVTAYKPVQGKRSVLPFNDPGLKDQWHYENQGQTGYPNGADINLFKAWQKTAGKSDVIVSIHDQGVDVNHPDLKANIWINEAELNGTSGVDDDGNGYIDDIYGFNFDKNSGQIDPQPHGTHVAGTIAAVNNNGIGVSGIAGGTGNGDGVRIMSLQALGGGPIERTFIYAANNGAVISQNSWGYRSPNVYEQSILDAIDYFIEEAGDYAGSPMKGGIVIFAAGNDNDNGKWYPGYYNKTFTVSSLGPNWKKASYSNYGNWVDIAAPGGESSLGENNGVLSTIPNNSYGYMQGTSMACPHVSGIAALALSNRDHKLTNTELESILSTSVVNIDQYNPKYIKQLGLGAIDASLAVKNNSKTPPEKIEDLEVIGIAQEFAILQWSVPNDDDGKPETFHIYYSKEPITNINVGNVEKITIKNTKDNGEKINLQVENLDALTTYYFTVVSLDRWSNQSEISNVVSSTTNAGPSIAVDKNSTSILFDLDVNNVTKASHPITILNNAEGLLRWEYLVRNTSVALSAKSLANIKYPKLLKIKSLADIYVGGQSIEDENKANLKAFNKLTKTYISYASTVIGDIDSDIPNSAAIKFIVDEAEGFNLTNINTYLSISSKNAPIVLEIYKGKELSKNNLIAVQEYNAAIGKMWNNIPLKEQIYFEKGSVFWAVIHIPTGNKFPLGAGTKTQGNYSDYCFMSFDVGKSWNKIGEVFSNDYAWAINAVSSNPDVGKYLVLNPGSGEIVGNTNSQVTLEADGSKLINGTYKANLIFNSNDTKNKELRVPVTVNIKGQQPKLKYPDIVEFGNVFLTTEKTIEVTISNEGLGNYNDIQYTVSDPQFEVVSSVKKIEAKNKAVYKIKYTPKQIGASNATLKLSNGIQTYSLSLFGIGMENAKIIIDPEEQTFNEVTIGEIKEAEIVVKNEGAYPLKYFIPDFDNNEISVNWPNKYHKYGYSIRSNSPSSNNPLTYEFKNISTTGTDITDYFIKNKNTYKEIDFGFKFPYYKGYQEKIYIAQNGFTTFDNTVRPGNSPNLNSPSTPKGYISLLGTTMSYTQSGKIYYQIEKDRIIIQFDNVLSEKITAQMVLLANGDIRFYYDKMNVSDSDKKYLNILIEDVEKKDGILLNSYLQSINFSDKTVLGLDYPGPNIIKEAENGSGIVLPNNTVKVKVKLDTKNETEGLVKKYINFITNDPLNKQKSALINLNITKGGKPEIVFSKDRIDFGKIYQGFEYKKELLITNKGNGKIKISEIKLKNSRFTIEGTTLNAELEPGLSEKYVVKALLNNLGLAEDDIIVTYSDNSTKEIHVTAEVEAAPKIVVHTTELLEKELNHGEISENNPFSFTNEGGSDLEYSVTGDQWFSFIPEEKQTNHLGNSYEAVKHNQDEVYNWIDITKTGKHLPLFTEAKDFWHDLNLPFPIKFYGKEYGKLKVAENGIISVDENPGKKFLRETMPTDDKGGYMMPLWMPGGYDTLNNDPEEIGVFYQFFDDDKIVITWEKMITIFGMGDPISAQVILYKNGIIKFQYKPEGTDMASNIAFVGVQEPNTNKYLFVSSDLHLDYGTGLAYVLTPADKFILPVGKTIKGNIKLDATNAFAGIYEGDLKVTTNDPANLIVKKPIKLTVLGDGKLTVQEVVNVGKYELGDKNEYYADLDLVNEGTAPVYLTHAVLAKKNQYLDQLLLKKVLWYNEWISISEIFKAGSQDKYKIRPGEKLNTQIIFAPQTDGKFEDILTLTTSVGEYTVTLKGEAFYPPKVDVDRSVIAVSANDFKTQETKMLAIGNIGKSELKYKTYIEYLRNVKTTEETISSLAHTASLQMIASQLENRNKTNKKVGFTQELKYYEKEEADNYLGTGGSAFKTAVKFQTGDKNFNLSDVGAVIRRENKDEVEINYEVRAGRSLNNSVSLAKGVYKQTFNSADPSNNILIDIKLEKEVLLYPNEEFYVLMTYPSGLTNPQGIVNDTEPKEKRYFYYDGNNWVDIQGLQGFDTTGLMLFAGERKENKQDITWLKIVEGETDTLQVGSTKQMNVLFDSSLVKERGDHNANIVIISNDTENPTIKIPALLHINEAPTFVFDLEKVIVPENTEKQVNILVKDSENNNFELIETPETTKIFTYTYNKELQKISVRLTPGYGDEGTYEYLFKAKDEFGAESEFILKVEVTKSNRAPVYIGDDAIFVYKNLGEMAEYKITDLFEDPDGDAIIYTAKNENSSVIDVYFKEQTFVIKTMREGNSAIDFVVSDVNGASVNKTINVIVNPKESAVYPNPFTSNLYTVETEGSYEIYDMTGKILKEGEFTNSTMYLETLPKGTYHIKIKSKYGRVIKEKIMKL